MLCMQDSQCYHSCLGPGTDKERYLPDCAQGFW